MGHPHSRCGSSRVNAGPRPAKPKKVRTNSIRQRERINKRGLEPSLATQGPVRALPADDRTQTLLSSVANLNRFIETPSPSATTETFPPRTLDPQRFTPQKQRTDLLIDCDVSRLKPRTVGNLSRAVEAASTRVSGGAVSGRPESLVGRRRQAFLHAFAYAHKCRPPVAGRSESRCGIF